MKKQYLFGVLAVSAAFASCNNEIEVVTENMKPEAEMEEVVGATLVSKGMSIDVNGMESRRTGEGWEETDLLGMGWYNVESSISNVQTKTGWESTMANPTWPEHRIFANHKFVNFATESNVYQGAHFVYYPYQRETKIQQKVVKANALDFTVSEAENVADALYDVYNRAFHLSAQDFISCDEDNDDVDENGRLNKKFHLSQMVNGMTVYATPTLEETATAIKGLKISSVEILSQQGETFSEEFAIKPNLIPAVIYKENGDINEAATNVALDDYIKGAEKAYVNKIVRNVASETNYDLSAKRDINVFTFPTKGTYDKNDAKKPIIYVNVVSPFGLVGQFSVAQYSAHTTVNKNTVQKLHEFLGNSTNTLQNILRKNGVWQTVGLTAELDESNLTMTYNINDINQWNDAVALASEIGKDATFTLVGDVEFTGTTVNFPTCKLTVVGDKALVLKGTNMVWPADANVDLTAANITVATGTTLAIDGVEEMRNTLVANVTNKGTIALNEYAKISKKDNAQINNANGRIEVKYGSYVYANGGIVAFEVATDTPVYQINNLITDNSTDADDGQALVNTLVVNDGQVLDLAASSTKVETTYDPYEGGNVTVDITPLTDLSNINIEMEGGTLKAARGNIKQVNDVTVVSGTTNNIIDAGILGDLIVKKDAAVTIDATPNVNGVKTKTYVNGNIDNDGTINANVTVETTNIYNEVGGQSKFYVGADYVVWYTGAYAQGGLADGSILKKSTETPIPGAAVKYVNTRAELQSELDAATTGTTVITLGAAIEGDVTIEQVQDVNIVIDGNSKNYSGTIIVRNDVTGSGSLTIKNVNFVASANSEIFIDAWKNNCNVSNVTIEGCMFTNALNYKDVVGVKTKATENFTIKDCEAIGLHSLTQSSDVKGANGYVVENVTLTDMTEGGMSFGSSPKVHVKNVNITTSSNGEYGIRVDGSVAGTLTVEDCEIEAKVPVEIRYATAAYNLVLKGENTLTAGGSYQIVASKNDYVSEATLIKPTGTITITGANGMTIYK